jgi:hypothetical protein
VTGRSELRGPDLRAPQRPASVDQQLLSLGRSPFGQPSTLTGDPPHHGLGVVAGLRGAQPQLRTDLAGPGARQVIESETSRHRVS